ncbi:hypothetical protein MK805_00405 [Shimazuella sp. AN120528]|uniref:LAGLIDADG family homing endonuclease n=1 Tax=Shimazuella soli TaxID=1892854 RepID=UPI001F115210|nr:hypothetical protein [Shimazuella soli]
MNIDLRNPSYSYFFGFIQADGSMSCESRGRGRLTIEVNSDDQEILEYIQKIIPCTSTIYTRIRDTNYKKEYKSSILRVYDNKFRDQLIKLGMFYGKKSSLIFPPKYSYSEIDYFRGYIDGDGSLGLTSSGIPFLSIVTSSEEFANAYLNFIYKITGKVKTSSPNKRDKVHNIAVFKEDAQSIAKVLYYEGCLAIPRKMEKAKEILNWKRPKTMRKIRNRKRWTHEEDQYIISNSIEDSVKFLNRTKQSVSMRIWRIRNSNK